MAPLYHAGRELGLVAGRTIFDYADSLSVRVPTSCGRSGECHECIVEVRSGMDGLTPPTGSEGFLRGSYRLACQAEVADVDADIEFAVLRRQPRILTSAVRRHVDPAPVTVRRGDGVYFGGERLESYRGGIYGLAIDVGTTTVAMNMVDLESGEVVHTASFENPQRFGGSDVMHRISYDGGEHGGELRRVMLSAINFEVGEVCRQVGVHRRRIYEAVIVGNSTMRDIVFGVDVQSIGEKPYKSMMEIEMEAGERDTTALSRRARDLELRIFPGANVYSPPLVGCHVGSDVTADLLAVGMDEQDDDAMLVDVGTNTEVVVGNRLRMMAASCPAGPAFEGGAITYGMPGYDGAVEAVALPENAPVKYETIGGAPAEGICGSGLVDLLSELRRTRRMNELGVFPDGAGEFYFAPDRDMYVSRADMSALAQAKSANYCGQWIVLRRYGITPEQVSRLYLAGGFANYVDAAHAANIGFIANVPEERVAKVGNASLEGATIMLTSGPMREVAEELVSRIEHVELETAPDFFDIFVEGCMFKPMQMPKAAVKQAAMT